jgi:hypothetical protein
MHRTYELSPLLLIEGISVPISAAQVTFTVNQPAIGVFDVVPIKEILDIRPRSFVQFFVRDYAGDNNYKLMYEGEVYGFGFSVQASGSRAFRIETMDLSNYWDHARTRFLNLGAQQIMSPVYRTGVTDNSTQSFTSVTEETNYIAQELEGLLEKYGNDVTKALRDFMYKFGNINEFYGNAYNRYRTADRIYAASAENLAQLITFKVTKDLIDGLVEAQGNDTTFREIVNYFLNMSMHEIVTVPFPRITGGAMRQFIFKPQPYVMAPPVCNVIFPNQYFDMSVNRNFFTEPTRVIMQAPPTSLLGTPDPTLTKVFPAPGFYEKFYHAQNPWDTKFSSFTDSTTGEGVNKYKHSDSVPAGGHAYATVAHDFMNFSKEEYMKGIFSAPTLQIPGSLQFYIENGKQDNDGKPLDQNKIDQMLANTSYYMYYVGRYAQRRSTIQGRLNFNAVPGFPIMFIDDQDSAMNVVAVLESVTHVFSTGGGSSTIYNISHARQVEEKSDYSTDSFAEPPVPPWFNQDVFGRAAPADSVISKSGAGARIRSDMGGKVSGHVNNYGSSMDGYYQELFGCDAATDKNHKTIMEAARRYAREFSAEYDKEAYVRRITSRKYADITATMNFMGAKGSFTATTTNVTAKYSGGRLTSAEGLYGTILKERRGVIERYVEKLKNNKSFSGS